MTDPFKPPRPAEIHIASCVAYVQPDALESVRAAIESSCLADVPATDGKGRLVVLFECSSSTQIVDGIGAIRALPGVLAINLAYQHAEDASALQEPQ